jgi:hypothetical protein
MAAKRKCVHSVGLQNPRTMKRKNSPYGGHDRKARRNVPMDITVTLLEPLPVPKRKPYKKSA